MKLSEINETFSNKQKTAELEYLKSIGEWIKQFKPDAKTFQFKGYQESDDEGGSYCCFSSLYIDDKDFKELLSTIDREKICENFNISNYYKCKVLEETDFEEVWYIVRDSFEFKDFVYEYGEQEI